MTRNRLFVGLLTAVVAASPSLADGLWNDLYRGLDFLATPSGSPILSTADGTRINGQRSGRLRFVPDVPGNGYTLEFDRSFGNDSRGRPEILNLGALELQLSGAMQTTAGFTSRGFLIGNLNSNINNLNYTLRSKTGAQDAVLTGVLNGASIVEINQFGFYTINMTLTNANSQLTLDGVVANVGDSTDFDLGPIAIEGNLFFDGFVALLSSFGVDTSELQRLTPDSPIDRIAEAIESQVQQNALVAGVAFDNDAFTLGTTSDGLPSALALPTAGGFDSAGEPLEAAASGESAVVPEPSALVLIATGLGVWIGRRRRR